MIKRSTYGIFSFVFLFFFSTNLLAQDIELYDTQCNSLDLSKWSLWINQQVGGSEEYLKFAGGHLLVDIPGNSGWGTTGIVTKTPLITVPVEKNIFHSLLLTFDMTRTDNGWVGLVKDKEQNPYIQEHIYLHLVKKSQKMRIALLVGQGGNNQIAGHYDVPLQKGIMVELRFSAEFIELIDSEGFARGSMQLPSWIKPGNQLFAFIFAEAPEENGRAQIAVDHILVMQGQGMEVKAPPARPGGPGIDEEEQALLDALHKYFETH